MNKHPFIQRTTPSRAETLYRSLLLLYPTSFRHSYEHEMIQTFRACYRATLQHEGKAGLTRLWSLLLRDLVVTVCSEHVRATISFLKQMFDLQAKEYSLMSVLTLDVATRTDIGLKRAVNEDNVTSVVPEDPQIMMQKGALFVVADGMGGHTQGNVASELAVNTIRDAYYQDTSNDTSASLRKAVERANLVIFERNGAQSEATEEIKPVTGMGTTCVAVVLKENIAYIANTGDSLVYLVRAGQVRQIAEDHSWVAEQVRIGKMTQAEADAADNKNVITRCLGMVNTVDVYIGTEQVQDRDILILCTDGLHIQVNEDEMRTIVEQYEPEESAQRLIARANENGGPDNITAVVVHVSLSNH